MLSGTKYKAIGALVAMALTAAPSLSMAQASKSPPSPSQQGANQSVLRVVPNAPLKLLDPVWTSIYITRNHGYLIYDTLFALDATGTPRAQMVDSWATSPDGLTWTFKLRDGLKWHDGANVTAEDCVASLKRWGKRSGVGQHLFITISEIAAADAKTISIKLRAPFPAMLGALAELSSFVPFMMPKRVAETDPYTPIHEYVGSGPFIFKQDEFVPGKKAVYLKNPAYVPRAEPPSWAAGGKVVKVDRLEWTSYSEPAAEIDALLRNKVDYLEAPDPRLISRVEDRKDIFVGMTGPDPFVGLAVFNHQIPPFDKPGIRRAVMMAMDQHDYMRAAIGSERYWKLCYSVYPCNSPLATDVGSDFLKTGTMESAKKALQDAGYDGTPVVILNATDIPAIAAFTKVTADKLRKLGMKVDVRDTDWAGMATARVDRKGWNLFHTFWAGSDMSDPTRIVFSGDATNGWFGWIDDKELEKLRYDFVMAQSAVQREKIAASVQERLWTIGAAAHLGQFFLPVAYRTAVQGVLVAPVQFYWNMSVEK